jgi:hypothetical protein
MSLRIQGFSNTKLRKILRSRRSFKKKLNANSSAYNLANKWLWQRDLNVEENLKFKIQSGFARNEISFAFAQPTEIMFSHSIRMEAADWNNFAFS